MSKKTKEYIATYLLDDRSYVHPEIIFAKNDKEAIKKAILKLDSLVDDCILDTLYDEDDEEIFCLSDYSDEEIETAWKNLLTEAFNYKNKGYKYKNVSNS